MTWDDHKKNFARLARDGGYTIAQYAAEFNLNPNTARRYLRAFKEDTRTADSRKPNKPVRKPLKSMIIDHANDQRACGHIVAEMAEKQRVNAVVSAAVENAKRQNKRINDRSDDHDVITRAHGLMNNSLTMPDRNYCALSGLSFTGCPFLVLRLRVTDAADLTFFSSRVMAICFFTFSISARRYIFACGQRSQMIGSIES